MAHEEHKLSKQLTADALARYTASVDPYGSDEGADFRPKLLRGLDAQTIVLGTVLEVLLSRPHGNGIVGKAKAAFLPGTMGGLVIERVISLIL